MAKKQTIMYSIKRSGGLPKSLKGVSFTSYEQARNAVRRYIRTMKTYQPSSTHPAMSDLGFTVVKG
jgi:hypothetical protein